MKCEGPLSAALQMIRRACRVVSTVTEIEGFASKSLHNDFGGFVCDDIDECIEHESLLPNMSP